MACHTRFTPCLRRSRYVCRTAMDRKALHYCSRSSGVDRRVDSGRRRRLMAEQLLRDAKILRQRVDVGAESMPQLVHRRVDTYRAQMFVTTLTHPFGSVWPSVPIDEERPGARHAVRTKRAVDVGMKRHEPLVTSLRRSNEKHARVLVIPDVLACDARYLLAPESLERRKKQPTSKEGRRHANGKSEIVVTDRAGKLSVKTRPIDPSRRIRDGEFLGDCPVEEARSGRDHEIPRARRARSRIDPSFDRRSIDS
jgi:hypothetical protein